MGDLTEVTKALAPAFAGSAAIQRLIELIGTVIPDTEKSRKLILGVLSLVSGLIASWCLGIRILHAISPNINAPNLDFIATALIISSGTEGVNSILKFMGYAKDAKNPDKPAKTEKAQSADKGVTTSDARPKNA